MNADQVRLDAAANDADALIGGHESITPLRVLSWDPEPIHGELLDEGSRFPWQFVAALGLAVGFAAGLLLAVALIPDQPDQVIVPVDAPAGFIAPHTGTWSA